MLGSLILGAMFSIIHSSDGGVDDFVTTALISAAQEKVKNSEEMAFDFPAVIITNADCEPVSALQGYRKTVNFLNMKTLVGLSSSRVWIQFPWQWRMDSHAINLLPCLQNQSIDDGLLVEGNILFADVLKKSKAHEVKIIATGPLTSVADVFKKHPELLEKISEMHWMGGALDIAGNIMESLEIPKEILNEKAEWNVFCDAEAADWIFRNTTFPIYLYPLDISDQTISNHFMQVLNKKESTLHSRFVTECYKIVEEVKGYKMWDVITVAGILFPEVLQLPEKEKLCVAVGLKDQGALFRDDNGREIFVYKKFKNNDPSNFYETVANFLSN